jgi:hypothetical protein
VAPPPTVGGGGGGGGGRPGSRGQATVKCGKLGGERRDG